MKKIFNLFCLSVFLRIARIPKIAKIMVITMVAVTTFQACADIRSFAFFIDLSVCNNPVFRSALPGMGTADDPFVLCRLAHLRLIGDTVTNPDYTLAANYVMGKDIDLKKRPLYPHNGRIHRYV